ncbi:uncharacterized protein BDZ99DRAFT_567396 [Mytilinidion resinicola]|uniref:SRR1-like domain-containing protein n=1 Tax=Mytilinidion resinicola TaxID=574789 RepID=A0A6A6Z4A6_9PEZI|nr:uncharacterized protein BDZ99DRAFT_567396 [Mytilinidion resinicola]KAF2815569.1 hypothetical protein BDZ99DRAFT_567396 [Mytilinidion resinicola]
MSSYVMDEGAPFVSLATLLSEFRAYQMNWRSSSFSTQLRSLLLSRLEGWDIDQAIVFGLGCGRPIKMLASDPAFEDLDEFYLARRNIAVVDKAEEHVTSTTFVFSPFAPWLVALDALRRSPELYLGTSWTHVLEQRPPRSRRRRKRRHRPEFMNEEQRANCKTYLESRIENSFPGLEIYRRTWIPNSRFKELSETNSEFADLTGDGLIGSFQFLWPKPMPLREGPKEEPKEEPKEKEEPNSQA